MVILVTGAARGFGAILTRSLAAMGGIVVCSDILEEDVLKVAREIGESGGLLSE